MHVSTYVNALSYYCQQTHMFPIFFLSPPQRKLDLCHQLGYAAVTGEDAFLFNDSRREEAVAVPRRKFCKPSSSSLELAMLFLICIIDSCEHRLGCWSIFWDDCREESYIKSYHQDNMNSNFDYSPTSQTKEAFLLSISTWILQRSIRSITRDGHHQPVLTLEAPSSGRATPRTVHMGVCLYPELQLFKQII